MKEKRVGSLLFFLFLMVVAGNNLKASESEDNQKNCEEQDKLRALRAILMSPEEAAAYSWHPGESPIIVNEMEKEIVINAACSLISKGVLISEAAIEKEVILNSVYSLSFEDLPIAIFMMEKKKEEEGSLSSFDERFLALGKHLLI